MKYFTIVPILVLIISLYSCNTKQDSSSELITIDVEKVYNEPMQNMMLSEVVDSIEYIKLETNPDCLISYATTIAVSDDYIVIFNNRPEKILLFNRDGEYLNEIGKKGKGPGEYIYLGWPSLEISPDQKCILISSMIRGFIYQYNIDGSFNKKIKGPTRVYEGLGYTSWGQIVTFQQKYNLPKNGGFQLFLYDQNLNASDSLLYSERDTLKSRGARYVHDNFAMNNGEIYFTYKLNDTLFKIDESKSISPDIVVKMGKLNPPSIVYPETQSKDFLQKTHLLITDNFYFIEFAGKMRVPNSENYGIEYLVHNKTNGESFFLDEHPDLYYGEEETSSMPTNNIDGLSSPNFVYYSRDGIHADALEISAAKPFIESHNFDPTKLSTDKYYKKVKKLLEKSDIQDNPIIRICYLK